MCKIIAFANQKGGVGKTISATNLSYGLAKDNKKVLLIDLDLQANASRKFLENNEEIDGINEVLLAEKNIKNCIYKTKINPNLYVLPAKLELEDTIDKLSKTFNQNPVTLLRKNIKQIKNDYDYIILDNNPNCNLLVVNSIYCSDAIIVPVNIDNNAIKGVDYTITKIKKILNEEEEIPLNVNLFILLTMVTASGGKLTNNAKVLKQQLQQLYGNALLKTLIHRQDKPAQNNSDLNNYLVIDYPNTTIGRDYLLLKEEVTQSCNF